VRVLVLAATAPSSGLVAALIGLGALVTVAGHLAGARRAVVAGLAILFAASALMIAGGYAAWRDDRRDPRPCPEGERVLGLAHCKGSVEQEGP
jgi:hypothetical protein